MRRSSVTPPFVACALSALLALACSGGDTPDPGNGTSAGSGGSGAGASAGGSAGAAGGTGGATASGGSTSSGGDGNASGATSTGGASGGGNASGAGASGGDTGATGGGAGTAGSAGTPAVDDGCALSPLGPVTFSIPSGTFQGTLSVELSTAEAGAEIRYTTDHTSPTASSALYAGALAFTQTTELRAQAFAQGAPLGGPQTAVYVARAVDAAHDLPVMVLDSYAVEVPGQNTDGSGPGFPGSDDMASTSTRQ